MKRPKVSKWIMPFSKLNKKESTIANIPHPPTENKINGQQYRVPSFNAIFETLQRFWMKEFCDLQNYLMRSKVIMIKQSSEEKPTSVFFYSLWSVSQI